MIPLPDKVRAFVALRIGAGVERALTEFIERMRREGGDIRWTRAEKMHLTMRFLGAEADSSLLPSFGDALGQIAADAAPFAIEARGIGAFPNLNRPRVVWAGLESAELIEMAAKVEAAAVRCGFAPEKRPYAPHLTVGRVRGMRGWGRLRDALAAASRHEFGSSIADEIILYRSIMGAESYQELACFKFGKPAAAKV